MMNTEVPRWAIRFLQSICPDHLVEEIEGDLVQEFYRDKESVGIKRAKRRFVLNMFRYLRPAILLRNKLTLKLINTIMLQSYFKIAYRSIVKEKGYSFINIFGLALGIACCLLMFSYVRFEASYDNFHPNVDRTFRVDQKLPWSYGGMNGSTAPPVAQAFKTNYPEVEDAMRINTPGDFIIRYTDKAGQVLAFNENHVFAADSNFFDFFGFKLKEGNAETALVGANKAVISEETARKFFGDEPALGKILQLGDQRTALEISGVTEHQPENCHFHFDYLFSMETIPSVKQRDWSWVWTQVATYVRLHKDADVKAFQEKAATFAEKVIKPAVEARGGNFNESVKQGSWDFLLRPMRDIHLKSGDNRIGPVGNYRYVYTFAAAGIFVLLIAAINFINLSTARATKRAKEVGVKKTLGAIRNSLVYQFQFESIMLTSIATILSVLLAESLRILIARIAGIEIAFNLFNDVTLLSIIPLLPIVIGFLAGLYPSLYLTAFRPAHVLKGRIASGMGNLGLRNVLVVAQFTISIALIAGTMIVFQQLRYVSSADLGFDKENVLLIKYAEKLGTHLEAFRDEIETYPGVTNVGITMEPPGGGLWEDGMTREGTDVSVSIAFIKTDENYFKTMDFKMVAGRGFEKARPSDKNAVIVNETAAHLLGWTPEQAIGQYLLYPGNDDSRHEIIGVMKDFHYQSLHQNITPILFNKMESDIWGDWRMITVKFKTADIAELVNRINANWTKVLNDTPMDYTFLDQNLATQYEQEQKLGGLFGIFSALSILIAVIGLVGLVAYSAEVRKKEVGIRRVFGASVSRIVVMMNSQYFRLLAIAMVIATPLSWWAISQWLDSFAYRVQISPMTFVAAGVAELLLAIASVAYLSIRAATLNPSQVLREE
jgi:putative ABC transport system permease protein